MEEEELNDFFEGLNEIRETSNDLSGIRRLGSVPRVMFRDQENPLESMRTDETRMAFRSFCNQVEVATKVVLVFFLRQGGMLWCSVGKIPLWFPPIIFSLTRW